MSSQETAVTAAMARRRAASHAKASLLATAQRLQVAARLSPLRAARIEAEGTGVPRSSRKIYLGGHWLEAPVFKRRELAAGCELPGPAIIEQEDTTTVLPSGWEARVAPTGEIVATFTRDS